MSKFMHGEERAYNCLGIRLYPSLEGFYIFADYACERNLCV